MADMDTNKMLDAYILDYMNKKKLHASAKAFMKEGKISKRPAVNVIDAPAGFLCEWWSVFWDIFLASTNSKCSDAAALYLETHQLMEKEKQLQSEILKHQMMQEYRQRTPSSSNICSVPGIPDNVLGQSASCGKQYADNLKHGEVVQVARPSIFVASEELHTHLSRTASNMGDTHLAKNNMIESLDPALFGVPGSMRSRARTPAGIYLGVKPLPPKGLPLMGHDQLHLYSTQLSSFRRPESQQQFQQLALLQQQELSGEAPKNYRSMLTANCGHPSRVTAGTSSGGLSDKDSQSFECVGAPRVHLFVQPSSPSVGAVSGDQAEDCPRDQQHQQLLQRKKSGSLGTANSAGTCDLTGPFTTALSAGDGISMENASEHSGMTSKTRMNIFAEMRGNVHPLEQRENLNNSVAVASLDDDVDSFLSHDNENVDDPLGDTLKRNSNASKGVTLSEVGCLRSSNSKVVCCHFSSDGKLLASAGHGKKVLLWNMDTLETENLPEEHSLLITDVRFKPNSTYLATSSFDRTLRLWNAAEPLHSVCSLVGHMTQVMSLDFHQANADLLCSCDANGEIRFWSVKEHATSSVIQERSFNNFMCNLLKARQVYIALRKSLDIDKQRLDIDLLKAHQGGSSQVRFQHGSGHLLAAAADNLVNVFDVEAQSCQYSLKGHKKNVRSICWNLDGEILASVSEECVKVWSLSSEHGESIRQLTSSGNNFQSCVFHPIYAHLLLVSGYQSIELWDYVADRSTTVAAHDGLIAGLAQSSVTGMIATASHDKCVKLWK